MFNYTNKEVYNILKNNPSIVHDEKKQVVKVRSVLSDLAEEVVFHLLELGVPKEKVDSVISYAFSKNNNSKRIKFIYEDRKTDFRNINNKCAICGSSELLQVHHIKKSAYFPELTYNSDNWLTLCSKCHKKIHHEEPRIKELFNNV